MKRKNSCFSSTAHLEYLCDWFCGFSPHQSILPFSRQKLGDLGFNLALTLSTPGFTQTPPARRLVSKDPSQLRSPSSGCHMHFWPTSYKPGFSQPFFRFKNLLGWLTELRAALFMLTSLLYNKGNDKGYRWTVRWRWLDRVWKGTECLLPRRCSTQSLQYSSLGNPTDRGA